MYVVTVLEGIPNVNASVKPYDFFVVLYFYNYFDVGPTASIQYLWNNSRLKIKPIIGLDYSYGTKKGSWANFNVGFRF